MFKDYYLILGISINASFDDIKEAYRNASKKWHPDLNPGIDTTKMMQDINEAYAILKNIDTRKRYDSEYLLFTKEKENATSPTTTGRQSDMNDWSFDYDVKDENLKEDIYSAREYAKDLVEEFMKSLKSDSKKAVTGAWGEAKGYIIVAFILPIIGLIVSQCS